MTRRRALAYLLAIGVYGAGFAGYYHERLLRLFLGDLSELRDRYRHYRELAPAARALYAAGALTGDLDRRLAARPEGTDTLAFFETAMARDLAAGRIVYLAGWPFAEIEAAVLASLDGG